MNNESFCIAISQTAFKVPEEAQISKNLLQYPLIPSCEIYEQLEDRILILLILVLRRSIPLPLIKYAVVLYDKVLFSSKLSYLPL
jgi:hypothetical protein